MSGSKISRQQEIINFLLSPIEEGQDFANYYSQIVIKTERVEELYELATGRFTGHLPKRSQEMVLFRAAYLLEKVYFTDKRLFVPYLDTFLRDFNRTESESAKRHFAKMMFHILRDNPEMPTPTQSEKIAETCVAWITNQKAKAAVKIWSVETLIILQNRIVWVEYILSELLETFAFDPTPSMVSRMKRWKNKIQINHLNQ